MRTSTLLLILAVQQLALCDLVSIKTVEDYLAILNEVNTGDFNFSKTISLESDLDFSNHQADLAPMGTKKEPFRGTFLGNKHTISHYTLEGSTFENAGFFGYAVEGAAISGLVLDATCSVTSSWNGTSTAYVGGVLGLCELKVSTPGIDKGLSVTDTVSMASVAYTGPAGTVYIGGVVGYVKMGLSSMAEISGCAFGGRLSSTKSKAKIAYMGGILGSVYSIYTSIYHLTLDRCMSIGSFNVTVDRNTGGIIGRSTGNNTISNCFYNMTAFRRPAGTTNYVGTKFVRMMGFKDDFRIVSDGSMLLGDRIRGFVESEAYADLLEWMFQTHTMSFNSNGGAHVEPVETYPIVAEVPKKTTRYFYVFKRWTLDAEHKTEFTTEMFYDTNFTVYAEWKFKWQMFGMIFDIFFVAIVGIIFLYDVINPLFYF